MSEPVRRILLVDDSKTNLDVLVEIVRDQGWKPAAALNGARALELAEKLRPDLILCDIMMPDMDGYEVVERLKSKPETRDIPVVFISALADAEDKARGFAAGAEGYFIKPFDVVEVRTRIRVFMELVAARRALARRREDVEGAAARRTSELRAAQREIVFRLGLATDLRDRSTGAHLKRIRRYSRILGRAAGMDGPTSEIFSQAAALHDVGMIGVPDAVLFKKTPLDDEERRILRRHPELGARILTNGSSTLVKLAETIALRHHEHYDGTGYPGGLAGGDIPLEARIVCICDVFDALTTARPYKPAWSVEDAAAEISRLSGAVFDPKLVDLFLDALPRLERIRNKLPEQDAVGEAF